MNKMFLLRFSGVIQMCLFLTCCGGAPLQKPVSDKPLEEQKSQDAIRDSAPSHKIDVEPDEVPFKPYKMGDNLTHLEKNLYEIMEKYQIAGMQAAVIIGDSILWNGAFGWFDIHGEIPLRSDHNMRIASISKSFAGLAAMKLVQEGKFNLDVDVNAYLNLPVVIRNPHYPDVPITGRQLMNHTSSILNGQYVEYVVASRGQNPVTITLADYFAENGTFNKPENWAKTIPGEKFSYSNMGTIVLAAVIEKLSGEEFNLYARENVLIPLGMRDSSFNSRDLNPDRSAKMYRRKEVGGQVSFSWTPVPKSASYEGYIPGMNGGLSSPQGGLVSNALDLSKFALAMTHRGKSDGKSLFSKDVIEEMHRQSVHITTKEESPKALYKQKGLCIHITEDLIPGYVFYGHSGSAYGIISHLYYTMDLPENFGFAIIFNGCDMSKREDHPFYRIEEEVIALFYDSFISKN